MIALFNGWQGKEYPQRLAATVRGGGKRDIARHTIGEDDRQALQTLGLYVIVEFPKIDGASRCKDWRSNRRSIRPTAGKSIAEYSAINPFAPDESTGGGFEHIGRVQRPVTVRSGGLSLSRGALLPCLFFNPKIKEVSHV